MKYIYLLTLLPFYAALSSCDKVPSYVSSIKFKLNGQQQEFLLVSSSVYRNAFGSSSQGGQTLTIYAAENSGSRKFSLVINAAPVLIEEYWYTHLPPVYNTGNYFTYVDETGKEYASNKNPLGISPSFKCKFKSITVDQDEPANSNANGSFEAVVFYQSTPTTVDKLVFTEGEFLVDAD